MNLKNKKKNMFLLKLLLIVCFNAVGHKICNLYAWSQVKNEFKLSLEGTAPTSNFPIFISAGTMDEKDSVYPNPDNKKYGDQGNGQHLTVNYCNNTANSRASSIPNIKVGVPCSKNVPYTITAALHYIQDMSTPVHNPAIWYNWANDYGDKYYFFGDGVDNTTLHKAYESTGTYGINCSPTSPTSTAGCSIYSDVSSRLSAQNTILNSITTANGSVFTSTAFKNEMFKRLKNWYAAYKAKNTAKIKNYLLNDIAFACCVERRFWKGHSHLKTLFK